MKSLDIGATGMLAQQLNVDVISNNIANMNTSGYKRQRAQFQDLLYQNKVRPGATSSDVGTIVPSGIQVGAGVRASSVYRIHEQGAIAITENPLDIAINGKGWFQIDLPNGDTGYTRAGNFQINGEGELVTSDGYLVDPGIVVPDNALDIVINRSGEVLVQVPNQVEMVNVGQLNLAIFPNNGGLEAIGQNLFLETEASGAAIIGVPGDEAFGSILQGVLENSNVNVVEEMTSLITAQRAYEMNSKVIQSSDEMLAAIAQLR